LAGARRCGDWADAVEAVGTTVARALVIRKSRLVMGRESVLEAARKTTPDDERA
jgi:hypothetical protein